MSNRSTVTPRKMYKWVSAYPSMSKYSLMRKWPTHVELCDMFERLVNSKSLGPVITLNYPAIKREGNKFTYNNGENDL